jgi:hypothetical protein
MGTVNLRHRSLRSAHAGARVLGVLLVLGVVLAQAQLAAVELGPLNTPVIQIAYAHHELTYRYGGIAYHTFAPIHAAYAQIVAKSGNTNGYTFVSEEALPDVVLVYAYLQVPSGYYVVKMQNGANEDSDRIRKLADHLLDAEYKIAILNYTDPKYDVTPPGAEASLGILNAHDDAFAKVMADMQAQVSGKPARPAPGRP